MGNVAGPWQARRWPGHRAAAVSALIVGGAALRIAVYVQNRSLWNDEALLALNIADRSYAQLFGQLDFDQAAPPGFLVIEKLAFQFLGDDELALRLFPLLCGILSLFLFWKLASRVLAPWAAVAGLTLFALAEPLLYYAAEVKQYGVDVAAVIAVLYLAVRIREHGVDRRGAVALALSGLFVVWLSHAATITLAGVVAAMTAEALTNREWPQVRRLVGASSIWALSAAGYGVFAAGAARELRSKFSAGLPGAFAPFPPSSVGDVRWYVENAHGFAEGLGASHMWAVAGIGLALLGVVSLALREAGLLAIVITPVGLTILASSLHLYPLQFRMQVFLIPLVLLLAGEGFWFLRRHAGVYVSVLALVLAALPLARATLDTLREPGREETRPLITQLARDARASDTLYVYRNAQYALAYYSGCQACGTRAIADRFDVRPVRDGQTAVRSRLPTLVIGSHREGDTGRLTDDIRRLAGRPRVWFLFSHYITPDGVDERAVAVAALDQMGRILTRRETRGAALYLADLTG